MVRNIKDVVNDLKNKNMKKAILMFSLAISMMSCGTINQESSPMKLRQLANVTKTEKSSGGTFVLFFATYHSQEKNTDVIKVFAEVDGLYQFVEIPMSMVKVKIDNSVTTPYIQIRYCYRGPSTYQYSNTQLFDRISMGITITDYVITCPEQYLPERLLEIDVTK